MLKHSINYLNDNEEQSENFPNMSDVKAQLALALRLAESDEIDLSDINIFEIGNGISKSIKCLFENLNKIAGRFLLQKFFTRWFKVRYGFASRLDYLKSRYSLSFDYISQFVKTLKTGATLRKINFKSGGSKEHFYQLSENEQAIQIFKKKGSSKAKTLMVKDIKSLLIGFNSVNLWKKFDKLKDKVVPFPYLTMSLVTSERSIDLVFPEELFRQFFYGFNRIGVKTGNKGTAVFYTLKMKMLKKIKGEFGKRKMDILTHLHEYFKAHEYGYWNLSFVKVLLIHRKVFPNI